MNINGFIQARNYYRGGNLPVDRIVIHDMEHPEVPGTAKSVCQWFAGPNAPQASAHFCIDNAEIWGSVHEGDGAWHAPPNMHSIGLEHAGYARQTAADWGDPYSEAMLRLSARLTADLCVRHGLPIAFVPAAGLLAGERGITTHAEVSKAWRRTTHTDPGPNFPMAHYLNLVRETTSPPPTEVHGVRISTGLLGPIKLDGAGHGSVSVPSPIDRLMFVGCRGPAPDRDGYWPPVTWEVNDSGDHVVVPLYGSPNQDGVMVYWKRLDEE